QLGGEQNKLKQLQNELTETEENLEIRTKKVIELAAQINNLKEQKETAQAQNQQTGQKLGQLAVELGREKVKASKVNNLRTARSITSQRAGELLKKTISLTDQNTY